jgi:hypothetical protein
MIAQDVGSAIKGPERGDIYFGSGEAAGRLAGITKHAGHLFALAAVPAEAAVATGSVPPPKPAGAGSGGEPKADAAAGGATPKRP